MNRNFRIIFAIASLALAALACQAVAGGGGGGDNSPTSTPRPKTLLKDDFSSSQWGTGTDEDSSIQYANNALQFIVYKKNWFIWSTPNDKSYQGVHIEVTAINNDTDPKTAFGIMCDMQSGVNSFYYAAVRPEGTYAIFKSVDGQDDQFLTGNGKWETSDAIAANAPSYQIGMDCGNGALTLYVDGKRIDSVSDASYTIGGVALLAWSDKDAKTTDVSFDDFLMTKLP